MHTITEQDVTDALQGEVLIASAFDSKEKKAKDMKYNPATRIYRIRAIHNGVAFESEYKDVGAAVAKYNSTYA